MTDANCPFCERIAAGDFADTSVSSVVCFEPLNPVTSGHMLFVPRVHIVSAAASPWRAGNAMLAAAQYLSDSGGDANIITSIGAAASQTVRHLHVHLVPRRTGDDLHLPWTGQRNRQMP